MSLKGVAQETLEILSTGSYTAPSGTLRRLKAEQEAAVAGTVLYTPEALEALLAAEIGPGGPPPRLEVRDASTQAAARQLVQDEGERIVLLNFASARNPGGGFVRGAKAQEEDVARCSGLYPCLLTQLRYYEANRATSSMLYTDHLIYSPDVPFFRERSRGVLEEPFLASVITAPAPNAGQHLRRRSGRGRSEVEATLQRRAAMVLAAARDQGHRVLLLGAWGCGVFRNDPPTVARVFREWLQGPTFAGCFDRAVFGIYDRTPDRGVLEAFRTALA